MQTEILKVSGMSCGGCADKVTRALQELDGVTDVSVSLPTGQVAVHFDEQRASTDDMKAAIARAGYAVGTGERPGRPRAGGCCH